MLTMEPSGSSTVLPCERPMQPAALAGSGLATGQQCWDWAGVLCSSSPDLPFLLRSSVAVVGVASPLVSEADPPIIMIFCGPAGP